MRTLATWLAAAALLAVPVAAQADDTNYGKTKQGLRLGAKVVGQTLHFRVRNTSKKEVTFVERRSCSGHANWSLESRKSQSSDAARKRVRVHLGTNARCRTDEPVTRTLGPGKTLVIRIDLPSEPDYRSMTGGETRGRVELDIPGRDKSVVLRTAPLSVDFDSFP
jgi:hypothetical protein